MKIKFGRSVTILLTLSLSLSLAACGSQSGSGTAEGAAPAGTTASPTASPAPSPSPSSEPENDASLYEKAKQEGSVAIYTASTGITNKAKASFEKQYPGVKVDVYSLGTQALMDKVTQEQKANIYNADVVLIKENGGAVKHEMLDSGMIERYFPDDIAATTIKPYDQSMGFISFLQFKGLLYNSNVYSASPVNNWWDLTDPSWKGKVLMLDPQKGGPQMDFVTAFALHGDEMAAAYKEKFDKDIVLDGTDNAGYEFIKQLEKNVVLYKDEDDIIDAVAKSDKSKPLVGIGNSDDLQTIDDGKLPIGFFYEMKPAQSVINATYLFLAKNAAHPNAAKLLLRWMAGGDDGQAAGLDAAVQQGAWVTRAGKTQNNPVELEQVNVWPYDSDAFYTETPKLQNFWLKLQ